MTKEILVGNVKIGNNNPIAIQSMTNTDTSNIQATVQQIIELKNAGSELVRITVNDEPAAQAVPEIKKQLKEQNINIPIIGDFHYNGHILLEKYPECAKALDKYRINPGNVGSKDKNFKAIIDISIKNNKPVRIGVNGGSLDKNILNNLMELNAKIPLPKTAKEVLIEAMVQSTINSQKLAESYGQNNIILSAKMSNVSDLIQVYEKLSTKTDYPLHLGLTEAGMGDKGIIASSAALGILLNKQIGDTIRISLTPEPKGNRTKEVEACKLLLQSLNLRHFQPSITSCPGCGRTTSTKFQELAKEVDMYIKKRMPEWKKQNKNPEKVEIAVMGCIVNGPGESKNASIGISLPGNNENPSCPVYIDGKQTTILKGENIKQEFLNIIDNYIENNC